MRLIFLLLISCSAFAKTSDMGDCHKINPVELDSRIWFKTEDEAGNVSRVKITIPKIIDYTFRDAYLAVIHETANGINHGIITELSIQDKGNEYHAFYTYSIHQVGVSTAVQATYTSREDCLLTIKNELKHNK